MDERQKLRREFHATGILRWPMIPHTPWEPADPYVGAYILRATDFREAMITAAPQGSVVHPMVSAHLFKLWHWSAAWGWS